MSNIKWYIHLLVIEKSFVIFLLIFPNYLRLISKRNYSITPIYIILKIIYEEIR